jgi:hypothetical protein
MHPHMIDGLIRMSLCAATTMRHWWKLKILIISGDVILNIAEARDFRVHIYQSSTRQSLREIPSLLSVYGFAESLPLMHSVEKKVFVESLTKNSLRRNNIRQIGILPSAFIVVSYFIHRQKTYFATQNVFIIFHMTLDDYAKILYGKKVYHV